MPMLLFSPWSMTVFWWTVVVVFLVWLCQDYGAWRQQRLLDSSSSSSSDDSDSKQRRRTGSVSTTPAVAAHDKQQQQQRQQQQQAGREFSLAHYVLAGPLAVGYMVVRLAADAVRHSVFWTLWGLERAAPHVDDWLFETVTVWVPAQSEQLQRWWEARGQAYVQAAQRVAVERAVPAAVATVERTATAAVSAARMAARLWEQMRAAWARFLQSHDWRQLADDCAAALTPVAVRLVRLAHIVYDGAQRVARALWHDAVWVGTVAVPWILIRVTACSGTARRVGATLAAAASWATHHAIDPALQHARAAAAQAAQLAVAMAHSPTALKYARLGYRAAAVHTVWIVLEMLVVAQDAAFCVHHAAIHTIVPLVRCYVVQIHPRLAHAYQRLAATLVQCVLQPIYDLAWALGTATYSSMLLPVAAAVDQTARRACQVAWVLGEYTIQSCARALQQVWPVVSAVAQAATQWLERQAPLVVAMVRSIGFQVDWQALGHDAMALGGWLIAQAEHVLASLERTVSEWIQEQSPLGEQHVKKEKHP